MDYSDLFAEDRARWVLSFVLIQYGTIVFGVCKDALEFLNCQLTFQLCIAFLYLHFVLLLILLRFLYLAFVFHLLDLLILDFCLFSELFMIVFDPDDSFIAF